ncbi:MAG: DNA polymerase III subunit delta [Clostridia bacterium]
MKFADLKNSLKSNFYPVLLVEGKDAYLRETAVTYIQQALEINLPEMNVQTFCGDDINIDEVVLACMTFPFASAKKVVIVKDFNPTIKTAEQAKGKSVSLTKFKRLDNYISQPNNDCCLIFVVEDAQDFYKSYNFPCVDCSRLSVEEVVKWLEAKFKLADISFDRNALQQMANYCLCDMSRISNEANKLIAFNKHISIDVVDAFVHKEIEFQIYDLSNSLCERNVSRTLQLLEVMLPTQKPRDLYRMLYNAYRRMFYASISRFDVVEIAKMMSVNKFAIEIAKRSAKKYTAKELKHALDIFYKLDCEVGAMRLNEQHIKILVLQLLNL